MSKILIVDDEVRILMLIQTLLKGNGYETIAAKSGEEALGILAQGGIDIHQKVILMHFLRHLKKPNASFDLTS